MHESKSWVSCFTSWKWTRPISLLCLWSFPWNWWGKKKKESHGSIDSLILIRGIWVYVTEIDGEIRCLAFAPFNHPIQRGRTRGCFCFYFYSGVECTRIERVIMWGWGGINIGIRMLHQYIHVHFHTFRCDLPSTAPYHESFWVELESPRVNSIHVCAPQINQVIIHLILVWKHPQNAEIVPPLQVSNKSHQTLWSILIEWLPILIGGLHSRISATFFHRAFTRVVVRILRT